MPGSIVALHGLAVAGRSTGCPQDSGSNYWTGSWHHAETDLVPDAPRGVPRVEHPDLLHPSGSAQTDGELLTRERRTNPSPKLALRAQL